MLEPKQCAVCGEPILIVPLGNGHSIAVDAKTTTVVVVGANEIVKDTLHGHVPHARSCRLVVGEAKAAG